MLAAEKTSLAVKITNNFQSRQLGTLSSEASQNDVQKCVSTSSISLPVLVNEAISMSNGNAQTSVWFGDDGWAWLISDVTLFIWKFSQATSRCICKQLKLDWVPKRQYHAQLVFAGHCHNSATDGIVVAIALTSDGHVTYWPNIIRSVASAVYLDGPELAVNEEFLRILPFKGKCYLAVTSTGDLYQLNPNGHTIACTRLQRSSGIFAGIGRRMSSLFFNQDCRVRVVNIVLLQTSVECCDIILLTDRSVQRREVSSSNKVGCHDRLVCQVDINDLFMEGISQVLWEKSRKDLKIIPMDLSVSSKNSGISVLVGCADHDSGKNMLLRYCICNCPLSVLEKAQNIALFSCDVDITLLHHSSIFLSSDELGHHSYKLVTPNVPRCELSYAIIWRSDEVIIKFLGRDGREEFIPIDPAGSIIGAGELGMHALLLESTNGLLSVELVPFAGDVDFCKVSGYRQAPPDISKECFLEDQHSGVPHISKVFVAKTEEGNSDVCQAHHLQSAFIHFNHLNIGRACSIIDNTFNGTDKIKLLNEAVISMSLGMIDDYPALDPRWAESLPQAGTSSSTSSSLILQHQLRDKKKAHDLFLDFLAKVSLWDLLVSPVNPGDRQSRCVQWLLFENQEKLEAAVTLANLHVENQGILHSGIERVVEKRGKYKSQSELTSQDIFFRQVSHIQDIFHGILGVEEEVISCGTMSSREICRMITGASNIFETMLTAVHNLRKRRGIYHKDKGIEFCPWTVSSGHSSLRQALLRQHSIIFSHGLPEADDSPCRNALHMHAVALTDILLSEYQWQMESLTSSSCLSARLDEVKELFQKHRTATITCLLEAGLVEKAAMLSEKFKDFSILMEIWDRKDDEILLLEYVKKFEEEFVDAFLAWLLERGKFRKLLYYTTCKAITSTGFAKKASDFMSSHPRINWLHQIKTNGFIAAHKTLLYLAATESQSSTVKEHYVSLSKLAAAFSDECQSITEKAIFDSDTHQTLLKYQETLPSTVLASLGVTSENMPVFSAKELIRLYICDDNIQINEVDFMKALDLLQFIPQSQMTHNQAEVGSDKDTVSETVSLKHQIWCKAILQDSWCDIAHGVDNLKGTSHTILAKTLELVSQSGMLLNCLPNLEQLLDEELLASISNDALSQHLVRLNFQHYETLGSAS